MVIRVKDGEGGSKMNSSNTVSSTDILVCDHTETTARIFDSIVWSQTPDEVYKRIARALVSELNCDDASIYLLTVGGGALAEYAGHGAWVRSSNNARGLSMRAGRTSKTILLAAPTVTDYINPSDEDQVPEIATKLGFIGSVSVPLQADEEVLGMYCLSYKNRQEWERINLGNLLALGRMLGVIIHHAQQAKKHAEHDVLIERKRLSAEIHDNISQLVSLLKMQGETALMSLEKEDYVNVSQELEGLVSTSQQTLKVLREEILYLRAPVNQSEGLVLGIEECLLRFSERWDIHVELRVEGLPQPVIVSTHVELQLTRIVHEALSNILRHADASEVTIFLSGDEKILSLQILDNGKGFNPDEVSLERMGLRIMGERADSIGGALHIESGKDKGTAIRVEVARDLWLEGL